MSRREPSALRLSSFATSLVLVAAEPRDAPLEHAGHEGHVVLLGDLQAVDHQAVVCGYELLAPAGEPAPAAVGKLHLGQPADARP